MSRYLVAGIPFSSELYHHGIKGQRWGVRRFQNLDRSYTEAGKIRYNKSLNQGMNFSNIKDKKRKAAEERKLLEINDLTDNYEDHTEKEWKQHHAIMDKAYYLRKTDKDAQAYEKKQDALWKNGPKIGTAEFEKMWKQHEKLELDICGAVLRRMGFEDTPEARELLNRWDIWR